MQETTNNIPAFLGKLWKMVNDPSTDHLISWSQAGNTFIIQNLAQFWYELLPLYYKHNNMSSFVRQLNMYGFHKISSLENSGIAVSSDKDDLQTIQFYHPFFQKDEPEKLKNIKRKGSNNKPQDVQGIMRHDDLSKVLTDIKQLRGKQSSVDSQLTAMKQENAVLWRELAMLRQKHMKQQQIVNKLIQFLVTLVQPAASPRMGVGVKRRMPLMLHETPTKKTRGRKTSRQHNESGPTIHELDTEATLSPQQLLEEAAVIEEDIPLDEAVAELKSKIHSPVTPTSQISQDIPTQSVASNASNQNQQQSRNAESAFWDKPEFVTIEDANNYDASDNEDDLIITLQKNARSADKVFINPNNRDTLIGGLINSGAYSANTSSGKSTGSSKKRSNHKQVDNAAAAPNLKIATKNPTVKINSRNDLDEHLDHTQTELDQLKDILSGCNSFDANALLGLFTENDAEYGLRSSSQNKENATTDGVEQLLPGNEAAPANNLIDFNELFSDDLNNQDGSLVAEPAIINDSRIQTIQSSNLNTPLIVKNEPIFPVNT